MLEQHPCYQVWIRKGPTKFGAKVTAATDLTFVGVHRLQGPRKPPPPPRASSDTCTGLTTGTSWPAFGGAWTVNPGETCELRFVIVPKGGKARITITVRDEELQFDCKSGDEAVTAYFRLAVY